MSGICRERHPRKGKRVCLLSGGISNFGVMFFSVFGVVPLALQLCVPVYGKGARVIAQRSALNVSYDP